MHDDEYLATADSIDAARRAGERERIEAVQVIGGDVIGIDESGKLLMSHHTERPDDHAEATR